MVDLFILGIIGLILYNIIDTISLITNVRCILLYLFCLCALRAMSAYTDKEIKILTRSLCLCLILIIILAYTF